MSSPLIIDYYTDILCVWGWIAQRRNEELLKQFGNKIDISYHYIDVFGDAATKYLRNGVSGADMMVFLLMF